MNHIGGTKTQEWGAGGKTMTKYPSIQNQIVSDDG